METVTGGQLAAEAIINKGVKYIFTLSGGHITPIYQYLENSSITLFDTRHEQAAVFMAEAWGKMTGQPGVAMVTAGPGFTNALTGIASAYFSNTPSGIGIFLSWPTSCSINAIGRSGARSSGPTG